MASLTLPEITLTDAEAHYCETVGMLRHLRHLDRANSYKLERDGRDEDALGAYGEYVVSLYCNRAWRPVVDDPWTQIDGDVGPLQIRTTSVRRGAHLILHERDSDDAIFVLVSRQAWNRYRIEGWITGAEGKEPRWWTDKARNGRPAFFVPPEQLYDPTGLPLSSRTSSLGTSRSG